MRRLTLGLGLLFAGASCSGEVAIVHELGAEATVAELNLEGCLIPGTLLHGERTSIVRCPSGLEGPLRFRRLRVGEAGFTNDDGEPAARWFRWKTRDRWSTQAGELLVIHLRPDEIEQDFDAPPAFAH